MEARDTNNHHHHRVALIKCALISLAFVGAISGTVLINQSAHFRPRTTASPASTGIYYPPALYPQIPASFMKQTQDIIHDDTWYGVSAYLDARPRVLHDLSPLLTVVAAAPVSQLAEGIHWFARVYPFNALIKCRIPAFIPFEIHGSNHTAATVECPLSRRIYDTIKNKRSTAFHICLLRRPRGHCDHRSSLIPIGIPPDESYWLARSTAPQRGPDPPATTYASGSEKIAVCVPPVRGEAYAQTLPFFLQYYKKLGVDTAFVYMHTPGGHVTKVAEEIEAEQATHLHRTDSSTLVLLPWCMQRGASFRCNARRHIVPSTERNAFGFYFGQLIAHQDCLYRSIGRFRWVLYIDLDEYVLPYIPHVFTLQGLVSAILERNHKPEPPSMLKLRSAFYANCLPGPSRHNVTVPLSPRIGAASITELPAPAWSIARISELFSSKARTKYLCDPLTCDRVGIHWVHTTMCEKAPLQATKGNEADACSSIVLATHEARVHHTRAKTSSDVHTCSARPDVLEVDFTITNIASRMFNATLFD